MAKNIKLIRLFSGEELLGDVLSQTDKDITVREIVRVIVVPNKATPDQPGVGFAPFSHWAKDKDIAINTQHVLAIMEPITEFVNQYNATFGGLVVPDSKLILPGQ